MRNNIIHQRRYVIVKILPLSVNVVCVINNVVPIAGIRLVEEFFDVRFSIVVDHMLPCVVQ